MDRVMMGFVLAGLYNSGIGVFTRGFSDHLATVDPLFSGDGGLIIQLWGLAYFALAQRYAVAPAVSLVFAVEKLFFVQHWLFWLARDGDTLSALLADDPMTGFFYAIYGAGDFAFMIFFFWVAWRWRDNLFGPKPSA